MGQSYRLYGLEVFAILFQAFGHVEICRQKGFRYCCMVGISICKYLLVNNLCVA